MDERTLYKTLAEAPDDEGHCMVFADWLLERGDPMAEFLTLQLEHHKKKLDTLRAQRAQDLLIMNWKRWTGELSRVEEFVAWAEQERHRVRRSLLELP